MRESSACHKAYSVMRGFYRHNGIQFDDDFSGPNISDMVSGAIKNDFKLELFKPDEVNGGAFFDRELMQYFLSNLKLRDQAITLALLTSSQDSGDLFSLNVGDIRKQVDLKTGEERERIYWEGQRAKTGVRFKVFFTKEATHFVRRYLEQERKGAKDEEPLFVVKSNHNRMTANNLSYIFREVADKMGFLESGKGFQNPLRPKRLRHLFRTACDYADQRRGLRPCVHGT